MHALILLPVVGLAVLVAYRVLTGQINTTGLLCDDKEQISPERVQLLLSTLVGLAMFLTVALDNRAKGAANPLPEVSTELLALLGGSHGVYLLRKWITAK